jgi:hypothetical protein
MSTVNVESGHRLDVLHPLAAASIVAVTFGATMVAGDVLNLNTDADNGPGTPLLEVAAYAGMVLAAASLAVWLAVRARAGAPRRVSGTALGLAIASAATFIGFWSGWPHVFAAVAVALSLDYRRRVGSFSGPAAVAFVLGTISFAATSVICLTG